MSNQQVEPEPSRLGSVLLQALLVFVVASCGFLLKSLCSTVAFEDSKERVIGRVWPQHQAQTSAVNALKAKQG